MTGRSASASTGLRRSGPTPRCRSTRDSETRWEVRAARDAPDAQVRLKATSPDRRTFGRTRRLPNGGTVELDLGPLLVPAVYEFEAGVCYRRGYRFTITMHGLDSGTPLDRSPVSRRLLVFLALLPGLDHHDDRYTQHQRDHPKPRGEQHAKRQAPHQAAATGPQGRLLLGQRPSTLPGSASVLYEYEGRRSGTPESPSI